MDLIKKPWIIEVKKNDFNLPYFTEEVLIHNDFRAEVVDQMIHNPEIMIYYHCFYILDAASLREPELFYPFWSDISGLLDHPNSYRRDFALTLLATLVAVDRDNRFKEIENKYIALLTDRKFMTALCCLRNLTRILSQKPEMLPRVMTYLLRHEKSTTYSLNQEALFNADILSLIHQGYSIETIPPAVLAFIEKQKSSQSPKTRNLAKKLLIEFPVI
jgi:hypothetical protein